MNEIFKQGEEAMYGPNHVIITGAEYAFGIDTYCIMYADGTTREVDGDDEALKKIEPTIIHNELHQILLKLWEKDKKNIYENYCVNYYF